MTFNEKLIWAAAFAVKLERLELIRPKYLARRPAELKEQREGEVFLAARFATEAVTRLSEADPTYLDKPTRDAFVEMLEPDESTT